jgi:hypothetical protein
VAKDDARVHRFGLLVSEAEPFGNAGTQVVVQHVGGRDQVAGNPLTLGGLEVDCDRALPSLTRCVGGVGFGADLRGDGVDLDDLGTEVAQHHRAERARQRSTEVEDSDPVERMPQWRAVGRRRRRGLAARARHVPE